MPYQVIGAWPQNGEIHGFNLVQPQSEIGWLLPFLLLPLLHWTYLSSISQMFTTVYECLLSALVKCIAPSSTMKASPWNEVSILCVKCHIKTVSNSILSLHLYS